MKRKTQKLLSRWTLAVFVIWAAWIGFMLTRANADYTDIPSGGGGTGNVTIVGPSPLPVIGTFSVPSPLPVITVSPLPVVVSTPIPTTNGNAISSGNLVNLNDTFVVDTLGYASGYLQFYLTAGTANTFNIDLSQSNDLSQFPNNANVLMATDDDSNTLGDLATITSGLRMFISGSPYQLNTSFRIAFSARYVQLKATTVAGSTATIRADLRVLGNPVVPIIPTVHAQILNQFGNGVASFGPDVQANSLSVSIASDQPAIPVSVASPLPVTLSSSGGNPCINPAATLVSANGTTSGTAAVQIVALSGSTQIYLCSVTVIGVSGTAPTFSLVQGTGSNCASSQTTVLPAFTTVATSIYAFANPVAVGVAGNELCYLDAGTLPIQRYVLTYVQQ
jgi:hypothetical protein